MSTNFVASDDIIQKKNIESGAEESVIGSEIKTKIHTEIGGVSLESKIKETKPKTKRWQHADGR